MTSRSWDSLSGFSELQVTMAFESTMKPPICLVENRNEQLTMNSEDLRILDKICQPVVVVSTVGTYRTGKSYLMNHLSGQNHGFPLGSTVRAETKGIWMWCVPHPSKPNHTLVLLDTEGLGDVEKELPSHQHATITKFVDPNPKHRIPTTKQQNISQWQQNYYITGNGI
ncbi:hypothetical protein GHT09_011950 [Marmota monax]|uniref:GB1/RHD3-type G domain-containing protein n=1 Tax=Marmota monax TaxID=9995 RepID=A0A834QI73_MARMO|nr:hypothetical protein GHT09_011950 [Marmota monax]